MRYGVPLVKRANITVRFRESMKVNGSVDHIEVAIHLDRVKRRVKKSFEILLRF
jgi:hypothetical protein